MKTQFSLNYGEKQCAFSVAHNAVYELENGIKVTVDAK